MHLLTCAHCLRTHTTQDKQLQSELLRQGIATETPEEILPITVLKASELGSAYAYLGKDDKQLLTGRPLRDIGKLGFLFSPPFESSRSDSPC